METDPVQFDEDETEVPAGLAAAPRRRPRETIRIGRLAVPASLFAWGTSLGAHAAIVAVACVGWYAYRASHPGFEAASGTVAVALSDGGGREGVGAAGPVLAGPPAELSEATPRVPREAEESPQEAWEGRRTFAGMESDRDDQQSVDEIIGVTSAGEWGAPAARHVAARGGSPAAANAGRAASSGGADTPPDLLGAFGGRGLPMPAYPLESRRRGEQGVVKVEVEVLPDGHVGRIRLVSDPGFPRLAHAALEAAEELRHHVFAPATHDGTPVAGVRTVPYRFYLR